jgi:ribosome-binding protein aMBF1 (putative translation factor)
MTNDLPDRLHLLDRSRPETPARQRLEGRVTRLAREGLGLTQEELARRLRVRPATIAKLEEGTRSIKAWLVPQL